jgi:hypothetical protein
MASVLSPLQMRSLLSDPATGTAQGRGVAGNIGVMPDLRAIIENTKTYAERREGAGKTKLEE